MVLWAYPPTAKQLLVTEGFVIAGATCFAVGAHFSFANIAHQQARNDFIKGRLRKLLDD